MKPKLAINTLQRIITLDSRVEADTRRRKRKETLAGSGKWREGKCLEALKVMIMF